jgi:pyridoxine kinase
MPRSVLSISSQVAYGPVGNTASTPALHAAGFTVLQVPTIILSNHPGLGRPAGARLPAIEIENILAKLDGQGALGSCIAVMTGYFASADQAGVAARAITAIKKENPDVFVLIDPVLGDGESLYVGEDVANAVRDGLVPLADCLTPNRFELSWLSNLPVMNKQEAQTAAARLACAEIVATSIPAQGALLTLAIGPDTVFEIASPLLDNVPHGTGDFLSGLYLGARLNAYAPAQALELSSAILANAMERSRGQPILDVIGALHGPS